MPTGVGFEALVWDWGVSGCEREGNFHSFSPRGVYTELCHPAEGRQMGAKSKQRW